MNAPVLFILGVLIGMWAGLWVAEQVAKGTPVGVFLTRAAHRSRTARGGDAGHTPHP